MKKKIIIKEADFKNLVKQTILEWGNSFDDDPRFRYSNIDNKEYDEETGEKGYPAIFGDKEGYLHMNKWGDTNTQMFDDKSEDNEESWDELEFDDKRAVVDQLITKIKASQETCEIIWKL